MSVDGVGNAERDNQLSRDSRDPSDKSIRSDSMFYVLCIVMQKFLL